MERDFSALRRWVEDQLGGSNAIESFDLIAGDASPRRYFRVPIKAADSGFWGDTLIAVYSPASENNDAFLKVGEIMNQAGLHTPKVFAFSLKQGFFLIEDFGNELLLAHLKPPCADALYEAALNLLGNMAHVRTPELPHYDANRLQAELDVFPEWFLRQQLSVSIDERALACFESLSRVLIDAALEQPVVLVHRDFHSRNLMLLQHGELGVIDFQDAVMGPITYDAVSLLKDCYVRWSRLSQLAWLRHHFEALQLNYQRRFRGSPIDYIEGRQASRNSLYPSATFESFCRWFDLMGLQRHLKVLGVFARLNLRDGKPAYLKDLPFVIEYVREALTLYAADTPEIAQFYDWFEEDVMPRVLRQPWYRPPGSIGWRP